MKSKGKNNMALLKDVACSNHKNLLKEKTHLKFPHQDLILKNNYVDSHFIRHTDVVDKKTSTQVASPSAFGQSFHHRWRPENNIPSYLIMNDQAKLNVRRSSFPARKKSEASKIPGLKNLKKAVAKSPSLPKKQSSPDNVGGTSKPKAGSSLSVPPPDTVVSTSNLGAKPKSGSNLQLPCDESMVHSTEDLESLEVSSRENGSSGEGGLDDPDGPTPTDGNVDPSRTKAAIEHTQSKIRKTMELIKAEQAAKEENVNEYLRLAASADKQQLQRIKTVFEKKNQKSTQIISQLQKKLENYHRRLQDIEMYGVSGHKQAKEVLRDMGHGLKGVGANIVDGITGFSGGVVDSVKGAKDSIVSKPKEFAHLIKNKFGSADNINQMKTTMDDSTAGETDKVVSTLPARETSKRGGSVGSFKYGSDDDNSSITSGSGLGAHSSPQSASHNTSQQIPLITQVSLDPILHELMESKEQQIKLQDSLSALTEEFQNYKSTVQQEMSLLRHLLEIDTVRSEHLEEQINDMTELHQNEVANLRQDISSMEEKIEYRLDERTSDIHDLLENCQTRVTKMELQQQQQQIISMEMVESATFRTLLTKLINVVLAIIAVILVFVSTAASLVAPFLTTRARILSTSVLIFSIVMTWRNWDSIADLIITIWQYIMDVLPQR